jgi:hypothetical protein
MLRPRSIVHGTVSLILGALEIHAGTVPGKLRPSQGTVKGHRGLDGPEWTGASAGSEREPGN